MDSAEPEADSERESASDDPSGSGDGSDEGAKEGEGEQSSAIRDDRGDGTAAVGSPAGDDSTRSPDVDSTRPTDGDAPDEPEPRSSEPEADAAEPETDAAEPPTESEEDGTPTDDAGTQTAANDADESDERVSDPDDRSDGPDERTSDSGDRPGESEDSADEPDGGAGTLEPGAGEPKDEPGGPEDTATESEPVLSDVQDYTRFTKVDGARYERVNEFLRDRTYITAREWAMARLCADFRTETGVEMTKIGENLPELVPFMTDTYTPQAVNQARAAFEDKVRMAGATFLYGAMCDFFTAEELDDVIYEATETAKFLLEVEGVDLAVEEELETEDRISDVMREVRASSEALRNGPVECPECGHTLAEDSLE